MPIVSPQSFSRDEHLQLAALLDHGRGCASPYEGPWKANWLLCDPTAPNWILRKPSSRYFDGQWVDTRTVSWGIWLANGVKLTDPICDSWRINAQRGAFIVRTLSSYGVNSYCSLYGWLRHFFTIVQWLSLHSDNYAPADRFFNAVDSDCVTEFFSTVTYGGKAWALGYPQRCLRLFYAGALSGPPNRSVLANPFSVPVSDRKVIARWLSREGYLERHDQNPLRYVNRARLAEELQANYGDLFSQKFSAFLRLFETDLLRANEKLLIPATRCDTEYASHNALTIKEAQTEPLGRTQAVGLLDVWRHIARLGRHLPDAYPNTGTINLKKARSVIQRSTENSKHTPLIPLKTALAYTTESLRFVLNYGDSLVAFYIRAMRHFKRKGLFNEEQDNSTVKRSKRIARDRWVRSNVPASLAQLGIEQWTSHFVQGAHAEKFGRFRKHPSLNDALHVLVGAIAFLIGITKPLRIEELISLRRKCCTFKKRDGHWLHKHRSKGGLSDLPRIGERPIPAVTARAIGLLGALGDALVSSSDERDPYCRSSLFFVPRFSRNGTLKGRVLTGKELNGALDRFCDFVALPVDRLGRRWYVRIHELRKCFLIVFFWCFKFSSLDAARWMAEHDDPKHLYAYIQANIPGEELTEIEAQYAELQLWDFDCGRHPEAENVRALYKAVCRHFDVTSINLIRSSELTDWLKLAFSKGTYQIQVHEIGHKRGTDRFSVAFQIRRKRTDA